MKPIYGYAADYFRSINRSYFTVISVALSILIWFNYTNGLNRSLVSYAAFSNRFLGYYLLFASVFFITWMTGFVVSQSGFPKVPKFYMLLLLSPAVFALKVTLQIKYLITLESSYLNTVFQWPLKAAVTFIAVLLLWRISGNKLQMAGLSARGFNARPYLILLLLMVPILLVAGQGADFQKVYPKLQLVAGQLSVAQKLFFEVCYGLDFFTIELFFRGFLILAFINYGGKEAILPMAVFYCTIHFGKPVAECISSYFGGLILGAVVYHTRSIWGGLIIHLGIAWMMEAIGLFR